MQWGPLIRTRGNDVGFDCIALAFNGGSAYKERPGLLESGQEENIKAA